MKIDQHLLCKPVLVAFIGFASLCNVAPDMLGQTLYTAIGGNLSPGTPGTVRAFDASNTAKSTVVSGFTPPADTISPDGLLVSGSNLFVADNQNNRVGVYSAAGGSAATSSLLNVPNPVGLALSGNILYVASKPSGTGQDGAVTAYNFTTNNGVVTFGTSTVIKSGLINPQGLAFSNTTSDLYYVDAGNNTITAYNTSSKTTPFTINTVNAASGTTPLFLAVTGNYLFVSNANSKTVSEYNATAGTLLNASIVSGLDTPRGLAISGNTLFVSYGNAANGGVADYTLSLANNSASLISSSFVTGYSINGLAISEVPEPATWLAGGLVSIFAVFSLCRRSKRSTLFA